MKNIFFLVTLLFSSLLSAQDPTARVQFLHNAPSPYVNILPTVDVWVDGERVADDFLYRTATPFIDVKASEEIDVVIASETSQTADHRVILNLSYTFTEDKAYVFMIDYLLEAQGIPLTLIVNDTAREKALDDAMVDVAFHHGASSLPAVDISNPLSGPLFTNLAYGEYTPYISLAPASYIFDVAYSTLGNTILSVSVDLSQFAGQAITVFASQLFVPQLSFGVFAALPDGTVIELEKPLNADNLGGQLDYMVVAPNPATNFTQLRFGLKETQQLNLQIFDPAGRMIRSHYLGNRMVGEHTFEVDLRTLPQGIYTIHLVSEAGRAGLQVAVIP